MRLNSSVHRRRLRTAFARSDVGVHTGAWSTCRVAPGRWGTGLVFERRGERIPARLAFASAPPGSTVLTRNNERVLTPEHLLAALYLAGITDAVVRLHGPEVPALDGCARRWWQAIQRAGVEQGPTYDPLYINTLGSFADRNGVVEWRPATRSTVRVQVGYDGVQYEAEHSLDTPPSEALLAARTYCLARDMATLRRSGRGAGAHSQNTDIVHGATPSVAHHKLLDALGDIALIGPFLGEITVRLGSHALHQQALRCLLGVAAP